MVVLVIVPVTVVADGFVSSASTSYILHFFLLKKPNVCGLAASSENYEPLVLAELSFRFIYVDSMRLGLFFC